MVASKKYQPYHSLEWSRKKLSLQYQYKIKQTSDENKVKCYFEDYELIQYQIFQTTFYRRIVQQTKRRISHNIMGEKRLQLLRPWAEVTFKVWLTYGLQPKLWKCQPLSSCVHLKILINNLFDFIQAIIFFFFLYFHSQVSIQAANRQWTNKNTKKSCEFKERLIKACEVSMLLSYIILYFAFHVPTGNPCVPSWKFKIRFSAHFCVILC